LLIKKIYSLHQAEVVEKRKELKALFGGKIQQEVPKEVVSSKKEQLKDSESIQVIKQSLIEAVGHGLLGLLPLMEQMASDEFSSLDRKYLREVMGHDVTGRVIDALRKLTNEKVREQMGQGGLK
jgi:hypothetical protein